MAKLKIYTVSIIRLKEFLTEGAELRLKVFQGLPPDAKIRTATTAHSLSDCLELVVESEAFAEVPQGQRIPYGRDILAKDLI